MGGRGASSGAAEKPYKKTVYTTVSYQDKATGRTKTKTYRKAIQIYSSLPEGWIQGDGGNVPGYVHITNGESFFSGKKKTGYITDTLAKKLVFSVYHGASWEKPDEQAVKNKKLPKDKE